MDLRWRQDQPSRTLSISKLVANLQYQDLAHGYGPQLAFPRRSSHEPI